MTWSALHDACEHDDTNIILFRSRNNSNEALSIDDHGQTPLHIIASHNASIEIIQALIDACPQTVLEVDRNGDTPLHIALTNSKTQIDVIRAFIDACPAVSSKANKEGLMPLHQACRYCNFRKDVIQLLIHSYPPALKHRTKMGSAVVSQRRRKTNTTTQNEKKNNNNKHFVTDFSPRSGISAVDMRFYSRSVTSQKRDGSYPLHIALSSNLSDNIVVKSGNGGGEGGDNNDCKSNKQRDVIEMLCLASPDVLLMANKHGETPIIMGIEKACNNVDIIKTLLTTTKEGKTAASIPNKKRNNNLPMHLLILDVATTAATTASQLSTMACSLEYNNGDILTVKSSSSDGNSYPMIDIARLLLECHPDATHTKNDDNLTPFELLMSTLEDLKGEINDIGFLKELIQLLETSCTRESNKTLEADYE